MLLLLIISILDIGPRELDLKHLLLSEYPVSEEKFREAVDTLDNPSAYDFFEYTPGTKVTINCLWETFCARQ